MARLLDSVRLKGDSSATSAPASRKRQEEDLAQTAEGYTGRRSCRNVPHVSTLKVNTELTAKGKVHLILEVGRLYALVCCLCLVGFMLFMHDSYHGLGGRALQKAASPTLFQKETFLTSAGQQPSCCRIERLGTREKEIGWLEHSPLQTSVPTGNEILFHSVPFCHT